MSRVLRRASLKRLKKIMTTIYDLFPPISVLVCLDGGKTGDKFYNTFKHSDVGDGDQLLTNIEDRLQQWRCFIIPLLIGSLKNISDSSKEQYIDYFD